MLLKEFGIIGGDRDNADNDDEDDDEEEVYRRWVEHTKDRPFNDRRYAVNPEKLEALGWRPKTRLDEGLRRTVEWYRLYGEAWWGDVSAVLVAHPEKAVKNDSDAEDMGFPDGL